MTHGSRAVGMFCRASWLNRFVRLVSCRSTTGAAPDTVTVSCTVETSIVALIWALKPISIRIPWRTMLLKPTRSNFTE